MRRTGDEAALSSAGHHPLRIRTRVDGRHTVGIMRNALIRYRVMAYVVGTLLIVLVCVGMPLKYFAGDDRLVNVAGVAHGWLYMVLIITAVDLGRRARWTWKRLLLIALAGTVPFLSFVAERSATKDVRRKLALEDAAGVEEAATEYPAAIETDR